MAGTFPFLHIIFSLTNTGLFIAHMATTPPLCRSKKSLDLVEMGTTLGRSKKTVDLPALAHATSRCYSPITTTIARKQIIRLNILSCVTLSKTSAKKPSASGGLTMKGSRPEEKANTSSLLVDQGSKTGAAKTVFQVGPGNNGRK